MVPPELDPKQGSLIQMRGDYVDHGFQPHPIYSDPVHAGRLDTLKPVSNNEHIGNSVHRSAMEGMDAYPEPRRDLIGNFPMFTYGK